MIRKLSDGKFRLYSRKKIRVPASGEISGPFRRGERRYCTNVRSSISSGTERDRSSYPWCATPSFFAAVENQRHDEILLIVEVSDQSL